MPIGLGNGYALIGTPDFVFVVHDTQNAVPFCNFLVALTFCGLTLPKRYINPERNQLGVRITPTSHLLIPFATISFLDGLIFI
jgi:hypothetical protein